MEKALIPEWLQAREIITVDDVVRTGACANGVRRFRSTHFPSATAVNVEDALNKADSAETQHILKAAFGYGDGYGDGDGYGYGYGDGDGYGYGDGDGYGDGYGDDG